LSSSDREARERAAFAALSEPALAGEGVDPERIWDAVDGRLAPEEVAALLDLAAESPAVAEAWRLARELRAEAPADVAPLARRAPRLAVWLAAAAALVVALLSWPFLRSAIDTGPPVYRAPEEAPLRALVQEGVALPREQVALRWEAAHGTGWRYTLRVTTESLREILSVRDLDEPEYGVPPSVFEACTSGCGSGDRLYWRVEARHPDGRRRVSPTYSFTLR